ncbi:TolB family protein [Krasilnikovia sp. M28-CT-15]|uniref:TolB family protein n=1 Tax=Krasilnikovia sp. M28-CT-15 TaxID=3373540 RepID=UPI0038760AB1
MTAIPDRRRMPAAVGLSVALLAGAAGYTIVAGRHAPVPGATGAAVDAGPGDRLLVRSTAAASHGRVATVERADPGGPRRVSGVSCDRVYAAAGTVACLRPDGPLHTYQLAVLDSRLRVRSEYPLVGVPNRARVAGSGHLLAWTVFVAGDGYNGGRFSTRVGMLDTVSGATVDTLEDFAVVRDGRAYRAADLNFWGVTFADDGHFYATMSTAGRRYLVAGDLSTRTVRTIAANVECPSLSPDGKRLVFKAARGGDPARGWRLTVLDLATLSRVPLAEPRSVDDQAAWLDDHTVMYAVRRGTRAADVWSVPADGSGHPSVLVPDAESPSALWP